MGLPKVTNTRTSKSDLMKPEELQKFMQTHGLSTRELSEILGVTRKCVDFWTRGERPITTTMSRLIRLFAKYPVTLREF